MFTRLAFTLALASISALRATLRAAEPAIGAKVAPFTLKDPSGKAVAYTPGKALSVVTFTSTVCPISNDYNDRMSALYKEYSAKGVQFFFVNANFTEPAAIVAEHAKSAGFPFPVYKDDGAAADALHAESTPQTFLIDKTGVLRYAGAIDDARNAARVQSASLKLALDAVLAGKPVAVTNTRAIGCTIKRSRRS
jgi:peroxiredoxin